MKTISQFGQITVTKPPFLERIISQEFIRLFLRSARFPPFRFVVIKNLFLLTESFEDMSEQILNRNIFQLLYSTSTYTYQSRKQLLELHNHIRRCTVIRLGRTCLINTLTFPNILFAPNWGIYFCVNNLQNFQKIGRIEDYKK